MLIDSTENLQIKFKFLFEPEVVLGKEMYLAKSRRDICKFEEGFWDSRK